MATETATLNDVQCAYVRQLLFEDLHEAATVLVEQSCDAGQGNANWENVAGDDAASTFRNRVQPITDVLDAIGWSVQTDMATIVELERKRRVSG